MQVINLNGKKIAVGFDWEKLPTETTNINEELRSIAKKNGYTYGLSFSFEDNIAAAFSDKKPKVVSGALMLALSQQEYLAGIDRDNEDIKKDWIVVEKDSDDNYWLTVVKDGVPSPTFDILTSDFDVIKEQLDKLLRLEIYVIHSKLPEVKEYLEDTGSATPLEKNGYDELISSVDTKVLKKIGNFKKLTGIPQKYLVIAGVAMGVIALFLTYDIISEELRKREAQARKAREANAAKVAEEAEYKKRVGQYYKAFYDARGKAVKEATNYIAQDAIGTMQLWSNYINVATPVSGWDISSIRCSVTDDEDLSNKILCEKFFKKGLNTTNKMLIEAEPTAFMKSPTAADAVAEKRFAYPITNASLNSYQFITLDDFAINFISTVQLLKYSGIALELKDSPQEILFTPPSLPLTKDEIDKGIKPAPTTPLKIGYAKGVFNLSAKGYSKFTELSDAISWNSISLSATEFTFNSYSSPSWKADFNYILKTKADNLEPPSIGKYNASDFDLTTVEDQ